MRLLTAVAGRAGELWLQRDGTRCRFAYQSEGGERIEREASVLEVEPGIFSVLIDGASYELKVVTAPAGCYVDLDGDRSVVEVQDPRSAGPRGAAAARDGRQNISAPMPGRVVRVLVGEGAEVEAGAGLVVVEAMKMQNEMKAPKRGRVLSVKAVEGDTVSAGEVLVTIE